MEWPTWELQAHGSAAPAPDLAAPDGPVGARGPGCPLPRLDPLGPWCSARLTFADGARVDVLVTVSDDHITVEDVRADPPLTLDGLADLARWIDGPLDDAFRAATGQPRKSRGGLRQPGSAAGVLGGGGGAQAGTGPGGASASEPAGAGAGAAAAEGATHPTAEAVEAAEAGVPGAGPTGATGLGHGAGVLHRTATETGIGHPADPPAASSATPPAEPPAEQPCEQGSGRPIASASSAPSAPSASSAPSAPSATDASSTPTDGSTPSPPSPPSSSSPPSATAPAPTPTPPAGRARSAVLARTRAGERRKIAANAYRQAQREGGDPVQAVMRATGRNRRRSLRLIAGARDEGLLTPRHNKR
ncbi:DUF6214 family protein [Streptomyces tubercidicus]|uniref:DUF6214 family protein n=1 Tax=Streptomyces tubercidicus TaxID=47759 RepID=UPI003F5CBBA2